jgi:hypothetical protein
MKRFISLFLVALILGSLSTTAALAEDVIYGLAIMKISTRSGPSTSYKDMGTYDLAGQYLRILARAYDDVNGIWWVQCVIPSNGQALWTGYKRFDHSTLPLEIIPIEGEDDDQSGEIYGLATMKISTRSGPSTKYEDTGTYNLAGQYLRILARAYDDVNEIWWVKCVIPSNGRALWTGYKRFDHSTLPLDIIPIEWW